MRSLLLMGLILISSAPATAAPSLSLTAAKKAFDDLEYDKCAALLDIAAVEPDNDRATVTEVLLLQGVVAASLSKADKSRVAFRELLVLAPEAQLPPNQPPRVRTPYYEAKEWASTKALLPVAGVTLSAESVKSLKVTIPIDELHLAKAVVFAVEGAPPRTVELSDGQAKLEVNLPRVKWSASVVGEHGRHLVDLPSQEDAPAPTTATLATTTATKTPSTTPTNEQPLDVKRTPPPSNEWMLPTGLAVGAGGLVALAVGIGLGVGVVGDAQNKLNTATRDSNGVITSLTQVQAAALDKQARATAPAANALMIGGGIAAAGGALLCVLGLPVAVTPTPNGAAITGKF